MKKRTFKYLMPNVVNNAGGTNFTRNIINSIRDTVKSISRLNMINNIDKSDKSRVFILGGGPSLTGFDLTKLEGEDIIAVNKSIEYVKHAKYFITMDYTFISNPSKLTNTDFNIIKNKSDYNYFVINTEHPYIKNIDGVYVDTRFNLKYNDISKFTSVIEANKSYDIQTGFGQDFSKFSHGQNSGFCALQLALLLEYDEIYLLGFDLNISNNRSHFHDGYKQNINIFNKNLIMYRTLFIKALEYCKHRSKIKNCSKISYLNSFIEYRDIESVLQIKESAPDTKEEDIQITMKEEIKIDKTNDLHNLIIVGYYTTNTPYEKEAEGLINSCKKLNLIQDIVGIPNFGSWQSNTRFKAKFMQSMILKYPGKDLLYVDCDAVIHSRPTIFSNYDYDIAVRYQDFRWRQNECLSGTIFMNANERTLALCKRWQEINEAEGKDVKTMEQWNLDKAIQEGIKNNNLKFKNLEPEYTFIFDLMRAIYPKAVPVIEHYQASRKFKNKV